EHLLTFRSAAAGFFDLANDGGTGNFGGFKSSCTSNLVVANGVLNAPDYTRTCVCRYQNQTSLAMVHMPEVETWTDNSYLSAGNVISSSANAVAFFDTGGDMTCANDSFLELLGYDEHSEILGKSVTSFGQSDEAAERAVTTLMGKGEWSGELVALKKDGTTLDIYLSAEVGMDAAGAPTSVMVSFVDIDAGAVALFDLEGNLTYANDVFLSLLEYSDDSEVLGKSISDFWGAEDKILDALRSERTWKGEIAAVKEDGSNLDTYLSASMATDAEGSSAFISASFVDVTESEKTKEVANRLDAALNASCDIKQLITDDSPIRSVGINLGAPGDHKADDGILWLEYPIVGGPSPEVLVKIDNDKPLFRAFDVGFQTDLDEDTVPEKLRREFRKEGISLLPSPTVSVEKKGSEWLISGSRKRMYIVKKSGYWLDVYGYERFSHHSSRIQGDGLKWVAASGIKGLSALTVSLARNPVDDTSGDGDGSFAKAFIKERLYTVRLHFSEPEDIDPGQRKFDVAIQGQPALKGFDIVKEAGGKNRPIMKEFKSIPVTWDLALTFTPSENATGEPLICGVEVMPEGW
ncbi:MAG: PAS domain-containing protein, partial [candidate division Zixibacteria bacterium]